MSQKKSLFSAFTSSYGFVGSAMRVDKRVYLPFLIFAAIELVSLILLYLAPRPPFRAVLGPIIATFWGEQYLHYPANFDLLPKLAGLARMNLAVLFGSLLTGVAVAFLYKMTFMKALRKYGSLLAIVFILTFTYYLTYKLVAMLLTNYFMAGNYKLILWGPRAWIGLFLPLFNQLLALVLQCLFVYAIPVVLMSEKKFFAAIGASMAFFIKNFMVTLLLVGLPMLIALPLFFINQASPYLIAKFVPEIVLGLSVAGIVVNSLVIDPMITLTAAAYYFENKDKK